MDMVREARLGLPSWNALLPCVRQFLRAIMIVCTPMWVHGAPLCTLSSTLSCRTNRRSRAENEDRRLEALAHLCFSIQLCRRQIRQGRWLSLEQPPTASSWHLDLLQDLLASGSSQTLTAQRIPAATLAAGSDSQVQQHAFDRCRWWHQAPGHGKLYNKQVLPAMLIYHLSHALCLP